MDSQPFNTSRANVTWETCSLREWLNVEFYNSAFDSEEKNNILDSTVTADKNLKYSTSPGNDTTDKVFLLSITEAEKYFKSDASRKCQGTNFCYVQEADKAGDGNCWWWLRSPGNDSTDAAIVNNVGFVNLIGYCVYYDGGAVRPALWINLES